MKRLRLRLEGADLTSADLQGAGQRVDGDIDRDRGRAQPERRAGTPSTSARILAPEPLIESDAPEIREEALRGC